MEPATVNPFERLPEDLVKNIMGRVLWSPFELGVTKARRKLHLGLLCKQFWEAIPALEILEWEIGNVDDEQKFLHFADARQEGLQLKRLALNVAHPSTLQGILQAVVPPARETLKEIYLFLDDKDEETQVDWHSALSLFQECKNLEVLHLAIWVASSVVTEDNSVLHADQLCLKPFPALRSLTLFGFFFVGESGTFLQSFPLLESLELSDGQNHNYGSNPLKKFYMWGKAQLGLDVRNPALATVPGGLPMLLGFLRSGSFSEESEQKDWAVHMLSELSSDAACREVLGKLPGFVETLLGIFCDREGWGDRRFSAFEALRSLATCPKNRRLMASVPGCLPQLGAFLKEYADDLMAPQATELLACLTEDDEVGEVVGCMPELLGLLVGALGDKELAERAAELLLHLSRGAGVRERLARSTTLLQKVANLLTMRNPVDVQTAVASILLQLKRDGEWGAAMSRVEPFLRQQLDIMGSGDELVSLKATLTILTGNAETCKALCQIDGSIQTLVGFLGSNSVWLQNGAVETLAQVVRLVEGMDEALAQLPEFVGYLVALASSPKEESRCAAADVLARCSTKSPVALKGFQVTREAIVLPRLLSSMTFMEGTTPEGGMSPLQHLMELLKSVRQEAEKKRIVAGMPGCLEGLVGLLECRPDLQEAGAATLRFLAMDVEARKAVAKVPGVFERLLKGLDGSDCAKGEVLLVLNLLALEKEPCRAIKESPGCVEKVVALLEGSSNIGLQAPAAALLTALGEEGAIADLPGVLHNLVSYLEEGTGGAVQLVGMMLSHLMKGPEFWRLFTDPRGQLLQKMVGFLEGRPFWLQQNAADVLHHVAVNPEGARRMVDVPGCIEKLVACIGKSEPRLSELAGRVLLRLTGPSGPEVRRLVAKVPGVVEGLSDALNNGSAAAQAAAGPSLCKLALSAEGRAVMARVPGCLGTLFRMLESVNPVVCSNAVGALAWLAKDSGVEQAVVRAANEQPRAIENLVALLGRGAAATRAYAGGVLAALAKEAENAAKMVSLPGCLGAVVRLAEEGGVETSVAVLLLRNLAAHPGVRMVLKGKPDVRAALIAILDGRATGNVRSCAAEALAALDSGGGDNGGLGSAESLLETNRVDPVAYGAVSRAGGSEEEPVFGEARSESGDSGLGRSFWVDGSGGPGEPGAMDEAENALPTAGRLPSAGRFAEQLERLTDARSGLQSAGLVADGAPGGAGAVGAAESEAAPEQEAELSGERRDEIDGAARNREHINGSKTQADVKHEEREGIGSGRVALRAIVLKRDEKARATTET
ncbi:hypothetical protein KFL_012100020 [Klebsormidium nitens]|uniref:Vacuolar protein 8 n=1 Tax=Klebsormidium nitens TaxID=105231 RepID=A0A1Y1IQF0_KLENI|nr:hypothetical protein KFL_012100020 [Klebsormidium nitens]|eukprot:GAQ92934.1 hypothetical protein KFL_012100020 [Klebsormidium nitens]